MHQEFRILPPVDIRRNTEFDANELISDVGEQIGALALRCSETAGFVSRVGRRIEEDHARLDGLHDNVGHLASLQEQANGAASEIRLVARKANALLGESHRSIVSALGDIAGLIDDVLRMGDEMEDFAAAIERVASISGNLGGISRQTSILAINASIEAARAGEGASGFAAVAAEVKRLARHAGEATSSVSHVIGDLEGRARGVLEDLRAGVDRGRSVREQAGAISRSLEAIAAMITQFDQSSASIERIGDQVTRNVENLASGLDSFAATTGDNLAQLGEARELLDQLESVSNRMFNRIGHSVETADTPFVRLALAGARRVSDCIKQGLARGQISPDQLFDASYRVVEGSEPAQFLNAFVPFADACVRPLLDEETARDARIVGCCLVDRNGFLPTHITERSQTPRRNDRVWNLEFARNRQIFMDRQTRHALDHDGDWFLYTYRQDFGDGRYRALRSVFVPMLFEGRRWGLYELGYLI